MNRHGEAMETFCNPLTILDSWDNPVDTPLPDPYVIRYLGRYYCYATGEQGIPVLSSDDLVHWKHLGTALSTPGEAGYWAPCVVYHNGLFYMYYSSRPEGSEDPHLEYLKVAIAENPDGPFLFKAQLRDKFSIDPHVVISMDGRWDIYYAINDWRKEKESRVGTGIVHSVLATPFSLKKEETLILPPTSDEEIFMRDRFGDGIDWHTVEGPFYYTAAGQEYLMYSGNAYTSPNYFIGYATKDKRGRWVKQHNNSGGLALLRKSNALEGIGHNSVILGPDGRQDWIIFHGRLPRERGSDTEQRRMCIAPLEKAGGALVIKPQDTAAQAAPGMPDLRDFTADQTTTDPQVWNPLIGQWEIDDGACCCKSMGGLLLLEEAGQLDHFYCAANLRLWPGSDAGRFGLLISYRDSTRYSSIVVDTRQNNMYLVERAGEAEKQTCLLARPLRMDFSFWQEVSIRRRGRHVAILVNAQPAAEFTCSPDRGFVGLVTDQKGASYKHYTLTR